MSRTRVPGLQDVVRVKDGTVLPDGRDVSGLLLTVTGTHVAYCLEPADMTEVDATEWTGDKPIHLLASQVDVMTPPR
ncbi:hypothetical protein Lesp02_70260 [Lentzea sp. NBRC 105346]|uniref:hypothetical protein n=1 Tax=Lentzea sp. NBRC 105346 TaxID=3032205 RepID=UPI0024A1844C|nr:hypothetical protein [Lentzea sp. NBRC 105346]GLZ34839.1 hypothetical protein Lesp02_70260 [Lentzea sp. NBRC 105346]